MTANLVGAFQEMKRLHGFCPCCGEPFRLSAATLFTKGAPPRTAFDKVDAEQQKLNEAIERFDEKEEAIREKARQLGQAQARKRLKKIATTFTTRRIDPQDVKVLFDPVDYIVFRGLNGNGVTGIELIDRPAETSRREKVQESIRKTIKQGNVEWQTFRIDADGRIARDR
jgi:predicted Holliday junction resolvase-like endonuclease